MPRSRYRVADEKYPHFFTSVVNNWLPVFTQPDAVNIVLDSWRFLQNSNNFELFGYVVLENHLHFVARSEDIQSDVQRFKSFTAKAILAYLQARQSSHILHLLALLKRRHKTESAYQVWEEGSHPQIIFNESVLRQKLEYIHMNPVKRGYVDLAEHWRYSSARNYAGLEGLIDVRMDW